MRGWRRSTTIAVSLSIALVAIGTTTVIVRADDSPDRPVARSSPDASPSAQPTAFVGSATPGSSPLIKNVVLILADDLDWNLWRDIPRLRALQSQGTTFTNYVVTDSLCCPSRTSLFRSQYVHNHRVVSNDLASGGGWATFKDKGYQNDCLPTWLNDAGVQTALVGKFLNQFPYAKAERTAVEPGWNDFVVPISRGQNYRGYNYSLNDNGAISAYGHAPSDFLSTVLDAKASDFIARASDRFFLELATFAPHLPSPVAPKNRGSHAGERALRDLAFGKAVANAPTWLSGQPAFSPALVAHLDRTWQRRAESAESVADSVDSVMSSLQASGHLDDTLVLVTSDNGFHVGSYRLHRGKRTAYDTDTVVPLVAIGPGIKQGQVISKMVSEIDLGPTIAEVMGATTPDWVDGRSAWPLLNGIDDSWRTGVLSESLGAVQPGDPDFQFISPPKYAALRTQRWLYVEYLNGERELYNRESDPFEIDNIVSTASTNVVAALHDQLLALTACAGTSCRVADALPEP